MRWLQSVEMPTQSPLWCRGGWVGRRVPIRMEDEPIFFHPCSCCWVFQSILTDFLGFYFIKGPDSCTSVSLYPSGKGNNDRGRKQAEKFKMFVEVNTGTCQPITVVLFATLPHWSSAYPMLKWWIYHLYEYLLSIYPGKSGDSPLQR